VSVGDGVGDIVAVGDLVGPIADVGVGVIDETPIAIVGVGGKAEGCSTTKFSLVANWFGVAVSLIFSLFS
jgi:hypothetical protein